MIGNHDPIWLRVAVAVPAAVMLWILIFWTPKGRRQWSWAVAMTAYIAVYYFLFVRTG